jgi:DNA-binding MarR family transcriptional regulator
VPDAVVDSLMRASRALVSITERSLAAVHADVTLAQFRTLVVLSTQGPQPVGALAEHLDVHASTMTRMCNRLVSRNLIVRAPSPVDRREVVVTLTPEGAALVDSAMDRRRTELQTIVYKLTPDERDALVHALDVFTRAAGEPQEQRHETV